MDLLSQQVFEARVQFNVVFAQVAEQLVCPQDLGNSHQLDSTTHTINSVYHFEIRINLCHVMADFIH